MLVLLALRNGPRLDDLRYYRSRTAFDLAECFLEGHRLIASEFQHVKIPLASHILW